MQSQPDNKSRRYDRQLRLWASSGQSALESAHILLLSSSATSTAILKNLVLPGVGAFTILDPSTTSPSDAGNNFFLSASSSIGKNRAQEAVPLLLELNDQVQGSADTRDLGSVLETEGGIEWVKSFTIVVAHNLQKHMLDMLTSLLWEDNSSPPLFIVRSAGFLAEFFIQFKEHNIVESHSENMPSLRLDKPFPALLDQAMSLDFDRMDPTEYGHIPYVLSLVRLLEDWKKSHGRKLPRTYDEKQEFKRIIMGMKRKGDEENWDEAESQAYRCWSDTVVPPEIVSLFSVLPFNQKSTFHILLKALQAFTQLPDPGGVLPLTGTLPDMKADTKGYVGLQKMYKARAEEEKQMFKALIPKEALEGISDAEIDVFVKNAHALKSLKGRKWGVFDGNREALVNSLQMFPKETATHLVLSALSALPETKLTEEMIFAEIKRMIGDVELPEEVGMAAGEIVRAPTSDLPNTAAFLGGMIAQESIKMITKQYVPVNGYCVIDLVDMWTGVIDS